MFNKQTFSKDLFASLIVFLIALPLCLAIAIASGVDPIKGLITGIIGGIVVGIFSGSPLQVSGPSAGLAVMVLGTVNTYGAASLVPLCIIIGIFQIITAKLKVAHFFQATPPSLLNAMLAGIGALIVVAQVYITLSLKQSPDGLQNLFNLPGVITTLFSGGFSDVQNQSAIISAAVIAILFFWNMGKHNFFELVPGPLVSITIASVLTVYLGWDIKMIQLPHDFLKAATSINYADSFKNLDLNFYLYALGFAFIASAVTLLCVSAVDKVGKTNSNYNKQIMAQGIGNILCGFAGALPVVGVPVRSVANVEFGAKTKLSSILHGVFLSLCVFIPSLLEYIPIPALSGLLIYTGFKLLNLPKLFQYLKNFGKTSIIFFITFFLTISLDLLVGVLAGFFTASLILLFDVLKHDLEVEDRGGNKLLKFKGKLSFLDLPVISQKLLKEGGDFTNLEICLNEVEYLDPAISEHLKEFKDRHESEGKKIEIHYSKWNVHLKVLKNLFILCFISLGSFAKVYNVIIISDLNRSYGSTNYDKTYVKRVVQQIILEKPDIVLITGDMVAGQIKKSKGANYLKMWDSFKKVVFTPLEEAKIPVLTTPGNHDASAHYYFKHERDIYQQQWRKYFSPQNVIKDQDSLSYSYTLNNEIQFLSLDLTETKSADQFNTAWLRDQLRQKTKVKIAFGHLPFFPFAQKKSHETLSTYSPLYRNLSNQVDAYLSGHHHVYYPGIRDNLLQVSQGCLGGGPRKINLNSTNLPVHSYTKMSLNSENGEIRVKGIKAKDLSEIKKGALPSQINREGKTIYLYK